MSVRVMNYVWQHSQQKGSALLLLLAIADAADDDGTNAWPSVSTLAKKIRMTGRTVQNLVEDLEAAGEIAVERGGGRHGTHRYAVVLPPDLDAGGRAGKPGRPPKPGGNGVKTFHPTPTEEAQEFRPENISPPKKGLDGGEESAEGVKDLGPGGEVAISPNPSFTRPVNPSEDPSRVISPVRARAREIRPVPKPGQRLAAEQSAALVASRDATEDHLTARLALLERLETTSAEQVWWGEEARRPPRLRDAFRAAIFVPPRRDRRVAALVFGDSAALAEALESQRDLALAQRRIEGRYHGLVGELALIDLTELDRPALVAGR